MKAPKLIFALVAIITLTGCSKDPSSSSAPADSSSEPELEYVRITAEHLTYTPTPLTIVDDEWVTVPGLSDSKEYWNDIDWDLRGQDLLLALKTKMRSTFKQVTYSGAITAVQQMDRDPAAPNSVLSVYDLKSHPYGNFGSIWNREHAFPQSKLYDGNGFTTNNQVSASAGEKNIASDVANLFAADYMLNESRSNNSYGEWNYDENRVLYHKYLQRNSAGELTDNISYYGNYAPNPVVRGEIARSQLYMLVNWQGAVKDNSNFAINTMILWDNTHPPVAERDGQRQTGILTHQAVRNPFIDNRKVACYIWSELNNRTKKTCSTII